MSEPATCPGCGLPKQPDIPGEWCPVCLENAVLPSEFMKVSTFVADSPSISMPVPAVPGYRLLECVGLGGMGEVWSAEQVATGRKVAIKYIKGVHTALAGTPTALARFQREIELAARLDHPHIARVFDGGAIIGCPYYVMEFIEGDTLADHVKTNAPPLRAVLALMEMVADAVQHAHQRFVIHRDLKPVNIMVTRDGTPKLLDFGLAKALEGDGSDNLMLSFEAMIAGTPAFMSPEQAAGDVKSLDTRSDVYSLGVILYLLLTGRHPHDLDGPVQSVLHQIATTDIRRPRQANPELDPELEMLLLRALASLPSARYQTAGELRDEIRRYLDGYPLKAGRADWRYFTRKFLSRHRLAVSAAATAVMMGIGGIAYHTIRLQREKNEVARQATAAREARGAAENLIEEMIGSLKSDLEPLGRLDLLDRVAQSSRAYFENAPVSGGTGGASGQRAVMLTNLGEISLSRGLSQQARELLEQAAAVWRDVLAGNPADEKRHNTLIGASLTARRLAEVALRQGDHAEATRLLHEDFAKLAVPADGEPPAAILREAALVRESLGDALLAQRDYAAAAKEYDEFRRLNGRAVAAPDAPVLWRRETIWALTKSAQSQLALKNPAEAQQLLNEASVALADLRRLRPDDRQLARDATLLEDKLGDAAAAAEDHSTARKHYTAMREQSEKLCEADPTNLKWQTDLATAWTQEGDRADEEKRLQDAALLFSKARDKFAALSAVDSSNLDLRFHLAAIANRRGNLTLKQGRDTAGQMKALEHYRDFLQLVRDGLAVAPDELRWRKALVEACFYTAALIRMTGGQEDEAVRLREEARSAGQPLRHLPEVDRLLNALERVSPR